jgi:predicted methyltransferase
MECFAKRVIASLTAACVIALAGGCAELPKSENVASETAPGPTTVAAKASISMAISKSDRSQDDRDQDEYRHPDAVLQFIGARPGMQVIDVFSAGGYFTELLAAVAGPRGTVIAYNNPAYATYAKKAIAERYESNRLANVQQLTVEVEQLALAPRQLDAALFVNSYHDLYWRPQDGGWPATDPAVLLRSVFAALKSGGVVVVEDHVANPNADATQTVNALHRIDPDVVKRDFMAAGFVFDAQSTVLRNADDDHTKPVFDKSIEHHTDRILYRFRKP